MPLFAVNMNKSIRRQNLSHLTTDPTLNIPPLLEPHFTICSAIIVNISIYLFYYLLLKYLVLSLL